MRRRNDQEPHREGNFRSKQAVSNICWVLNLYKEKNLITEWRKARDNGELDSDGVDFIIYLQSGLAIPFQLKYTGKNVQRRRNRLVKHHLALHPHIKFIFVMTKKDLVHSKENTQKLLDLAQKLSVIILPKAA